MRMEIGDRIIESRIKRRAEARKIYQKARREGYTAALLEQERPNIFTQSVANIEPGKRIDVVIRYVQDLTYDAGQYEFVFPMVVGPRFVPGTPTKGPQSGSGTYADTDRVPDAARITPPVVGRGERTGHDISLELVADANLAIGDFEVPTHKVVSRRPADGTLRLTLAEAKSIPNRDFVLRYRVAGAEPRSVLYLSGATDEQTEGYFSLVVQPPSLNVEQLVGRREIIFVVDISGSMLGVPISLCKMAMREALRGLRPVDTFNIITFANGTQQLFDHPRPANDVGLRQAFDFVSGMRAGGGTHIDNAVTAALSPDVEQGRHRYVFFLTDGYVSIEREVFAASQQLIAALEARGQRARVFGFGVGSSVNRNLLEGIARAGKGLTVYATNREHPARAVNQFYRYIDRSVLRDVTVDWGDLGQSEVYPGELPDLFASHAMIIHGRYQRPPSRPVRVRGQAGGREVVIPVEVRSARVKGQTHSVMGALWARTKVTDLEEVLWYSRDQEVEEQITKLGLDFNLVTRFTSLVAVDLSRRVGQGDPRRVVQPVDAPEGVDPEAAGARPAPPPPSVATDGTEYNFEDDMVEGAMVYPDGELARAAPVPEYGGAPAEGYMDDENEPMDEPPAPAEARRGPRGCHCRAGARPSEGLAGLLRLIIGAIIPPLS